MGVEPTTCRLRIDCSTTELPRHPVEKTSLVYWTLPFHCKIVASSAVSENFSFSESIALTCRSPRRTRFYAGHPKQELGHQVAQGQLQLSAVPPTGFSVTGVDRTKYLLDKARAKASAVGVKIEWVQKDMRDFVRLDSFALVLSMFTSLGYWSQTNFKASRKAPELAAENSSSSRSGWNLRPQSSPSTRSNTTKG